MKRLKSGLPLTVLALLAALLTTACLATAGGEAEAALRRLSRQEPAVKLDPGDVVRIQMEAMKYNDEENRGIEIVYRFASPANKRNTGPLPRFIRMLDGEAYRPLLNHAQAEYGEVELAGNLAAQRVSLTSSDGLIAVYIFVLSRQRSGDCDGCWMTDSVMVEAMQRLGGTV